MTTIAPPFTRETAIAKVRLAEDGWNSRDPQRVSPAALAELERAAGGAAFTSPFWIWNEAIRLLALTGYHAAQSAAALRAAAQQQERWMLKLGALRSAA